MAMNLEQELQAAGCRLDVGEFRELTRKTFAEMFGKWTDEDLLCRPRDGLRFCDIIRQAGTCEGLSDYVILRTLTNVRKHDILT